jgi:hypothetical protein
MDTVTVETSELVGPALDWAVAKCEDKNSALHDDGITRCIVIVAPSGLYKGRWSPSTDWSQGGPIIEREIESLYEHKPLECWAAKSKQGDLRYGPTPLIAAMRCYVASKLGDTVQIPRELVP